MWHPEVSTAPAIVPRAMTSPGTKPRATRDIHCAGRGPATFCRFVPNSSGGCFDCFKEGAPWVGWVWGRGTEVGLDPTALPCRFLSCWIYQTVGYFLPYVSKAECKKPLEMSVVSIKLLHNNAGSLKDYESSTSVDENRIHRRSQSITHVSKIIITEGFFICCNVEISQTQKKLDSLSFDLEEMLQI